VPSNNEFAGIDPCPGNYKYTDLSYTCTEFISTVDVCDDPENVKNHLNITCSTGVIKVEIFFTNQIEDAKYLLLVLNLLFN
jgi:hypothetical protein